eukprot:IDg23003t1
MAEARNQHVSNQPSQSNSSRRSKTPSRSEKKKKK